MKLILKQILQLLAALAALYSVLLLASVVIAPSTGVDSRLDTGHATSSLFLTEPKYVFMARQQLDSVADKAILVGASNMLVGFRQAQMQSALPRAEVHNVSVGGSNITQLRQIVELIREVQTPQARSHNTFVIGLWYGLFASDRARWYTSDRNEGDTDIDIERYRYSFYRRTGDGAEPNLPPRQMNLAVWLIRPCLVLDRAARDLTRSLREFMAAKPAAITDEQRNAVVVGDADQRKYLAFWREYMGSATTLDDAQFQTLQQTVDRILSDGGRVVLVDLPIPRWHTAGSLLAADYRRRADAMFETLGKGPGVSVLSLSGADSNDDFSDEVHPKPRITPQWAQRLASVLNALPMSTGAFAAEAR